MTVEVSDDYFENLASVSEDMDLNNVWGFIRDDADSFETAREVFFVVLRRLIAEDYIRLQQLRTHIPLQGPIDDQLELFRRVFPKSDEEMEKGLWFFDLQCPAGCNWKFKR